MAAAGNNSYLGPGQVTYVRCSTSSEILWDPWREAGCCCGHRGDIFQLTPGGQMCRAASICFRTVKTWRFKALKCFGFASRPTVAAGSPGQNCVAFYLKAVEFSSRHGDKPRWLWLAKFLGSVHTMGLKCCQSLSFVLTVTRGVGGSGPLSVPKNEAA